MRASGLRLDAFREQVTLDNQRGWYIPPVQHFTFLHDVHTRWDSTFQMALRFKALKAPVNDVFRSNTELFRPLKKFELTASDWDRLDALITILQFPHDVQHVMAKEKVPVLAGTIPSFEIMMSRWERLASRHADLKPIIDVGLDYATKYYKKMDDTEAYVVAM
ncbi:hypothetical protein H0H92_000443, partial [Tricholoma furcatifolium]